jgi:hypothetical protein
VKPSYSPRVRPREEVVRAVVVAVAGGQVPTSAAIEVVAIIPVHQRSRACVASGSGVARRGSTGRCGGSVRPPAVGERASGGAGTGRCVPTRAAWLGLGNGWGWMTRQCGRGAYLAAFWASEAENFLGPLFTPRLDAKGRKVA